MAETAKKVSIVDGGDASSLKTLFSKLKNVYYNSDPITASTLSSQTGIQCELEFPVLSDGVSVNTGDAEVQEIKITTGSIWTSRADKGDSDISFQVASIDGKINDLFLTKKNNKSVSGIEIMNLGTFSGESYDLDVNKVTGSLILTDDNGQTVLILTNVEMYASLVVGDGDNPAYFNVTVTPSNNTDGAAIMILHKD
ncbi:MAG: hypothetical protein KBT03_11120 [Bacteroidales bacterium]|nr:hypothetical protein [Candidatus Scybalousia scybalohippi]